MKQNHLLKSLLLLCALIVGSMNVWAAETTYTFTSAKWAATSGGSSANWTSGKDGAGYSNNGVQVTTGATGANATSPISFSNVTKVVVTFNTNKSAGAGSIVVKIGDNSETSNDVSFSGSADGRTANFTTEFNYLTAQSGNIKLTVNTTTNSIYLCSITITTGGGGGGGSSVAQPTFSPVAGAVTAGTAVTLNHADADNIRYTTDGTEPTKTTGTVYSTPIEITTPTTIKAIAVKGDEASSVATAAYTISVTAPTFSLEGGSYLMGTNLTITSAGNTIYYNLTTDGSTPATPTSSSTKYTGPIALDNSTTKIKAIAYDAYNNVSSVVTRTYYGIAPASLPFSWIGTSSAGKADLEDKDGVALSLGTDYAASNAPYRLKFDDEGKYILIYTDEKPECVYFTAKLFNAASTGSKIKVQGSVDGVDFTDVEEFTITGAANATFEFTTSNAFTATHRAVRLIMSSKDQNVGVGTINVSCLPVKITSAEYATYCNATKALDFSTTGITVYTATDNETSVTLNEVTTGQIPANTPVVLHKAGADGTAINVPVIASADTPAGTNDLRVSTGTDVANMYVLAKKGGVVGFYKWEGTNLSAGKIYLQAKSSYAPDYLGFDVDGNSDQTTGIDTIEHSKLTIEHSEVYNLNGQRVSQPTKGLYIVNGKKVIVK